MKRSTCDEQVQAGPAMISGGEMNQLKACDSAAGVWTGKNTSNYTIVSFELGQPDIMQAKGMPKFNQQCQSSPSSTPEAHHRL